MIEGGSTRCASLYSYVPGRANKLENTERSEEANAVSSGPLRRADMRPELGNFLRADGPRACGPQRGASLLLLVSHPTNFIYRWNGRGTSRMIKGAHDVAYRSRDENFIRKKYKLLLPRL